MVFRNGQLLCMAPCWLPNPVQDNVFVKNVPDSKIDIYDPAGKLVLTEPRLNPSGKIDVTSLVPGIYLLKITGENYIACKKIVKVW